MVKQGQQYGEQLSVEGGEGAEWRRAEDGDSLTAGVPRPGGGGGDVELYECTQNRQSDVVTRGWA